MESEALGELRSWRDSLAQARLLRHGSIIAYL